MTDDDDQVNASVVAFEAVDESVPVEVPDDCRPVILNGSDSGQLWSGWKESWMQLTDPETTIELVREAATQVT